MGSVTLCLAKRADEDDMICPEMIGSSLSASPSGQLRQWSTLLHELAA
jgi:hypothetical protein